MATKAGVGFSENALSRDAGAEAAQAALQEMGGDVCSLVLIFSTSRHSPEQIREGVRSIVGPKARIMGGFAVGIITRNALGYGGYQVGVACVSSDTLQINLFKELNLRDREYEVGVRLGAQIKNQMYEGQQNLLLMYDSVKEQGKALNLATPLIAGIEQSLGVWPPAAGVGLLGDMNFNLTHQWFDDAIDQQSAMALVLSGDVRMDSIVIHGCKPSGAYHVITKSEGAMVLEIDGKPALDVIAELLGPESDLDWKAYPLFITLGVNKGAKFAPFKEENYANRLCMAIDEERRALVMFEPDLVPGTEVQLMRRSVDISYVAQRAQALKRSLQGRKPFFAFYINCAGRASAYCGSAREDGEEVQRVLGPEMPMLGIYSGVEIAKVGNQMQALDWTGVLCIFSE